VRQVPRVFVLRGASSSSFLTFTSKEFLFCARVWSNGFFAGVELGLCRIIPGLDG
jgi:hypothetical protein